MPMIFPVMPRWQLSHVPLPIPLRSYSNISKPLLDIGIYAFMLNKAIGPAVWADAAASFHCPLGYLAPGYATTAANAA